MESRTFSRGERALLIAVPVTWAILLLFHPGGEGDDFYPIVRDDVTAWLVVHVGTMLLVPLMAIVMFVLLRGLLGRAATVARVALAIFAVTYTAWEILIGIGTGILVGDVNDLSGGDQSVGASLVEDFTDSPLTRAIEFIGTGAWLVASIASGIALVRGGASRFVLVLLALAAIPIAWHVPPFGQIGLALFVTAVWLVVRSRPGEGAAAPSAA